MEKNELFRLILSIIICQMAGIIGSIFRQVRWQDGIRLWWSHLFLHRDSISD